jgi:hypothetical protein
MVLPPFDPPMYAELREWWQKYRNTDIRRLILEVQTQRIALAELRMMSETVLRHAATEAPEMLHKGQPLPKLHRRIDEELRRGGRVYPESKAVHEDGKRRSRAWTGTKSDL